MAKKVIDTSTLEIGTVEGSKVWTGSRFVSIAAHNGKDGILDLDDCLFIGEDRSKTYTSETCTAVWQRDFSNTKADNDMRKEAKKAQHDAEVEATVLKGRGDTIVSIAVSANTLSPEAQVALINGMFASLKAKV